MALGVGVDIISISRVKDAVETGGIAFLNKTFTMQEQKHAETHYNPTAYLAMIFACKEAVFKTFAIGWEPGMQLTDISIKYGNDGEPVPSLKGRFAELALRRGVSKILLSPSYDGDYAMAAAILF